ncbi:hypothetical protein FOC1_g10016510 [Fusarium oxysporum f. sp. cubense race 1]|uniref:Uncharacterized protein n=1 Tax=Fusarium oxysporum f. sp. cubense (strain race 1) TaxID=1229664 RepID=N4TYN4_FUSC1|nr:hypothetical protein FOC1_g10016510 [Fusarium oxysporum f. sp. cubense race 1]
MRWEYEWRCRGGNGRAAKKQNKSRQTKTGSLLESAVTSLHITSHLHLENANMPTALTKSSSGKMPRAIVRERQLCRAGEAESPPRQNFHLKLPSKLEWSTHRDCFGELECRFRGNSSSITTIQYIFNRLRLKLQPILPIFKLKPENWIYQSLMVPELWIHGDISRGLVHCPPR